VHHFSKTQSFNSFVDAKIELKNAIY